MDEFEDDLILAKTADLIERQLAYQKQIGGGATPLLDFQLCPVGARVNWRNALNKQRFEARLQRHRDATPRDDLGRESRMPFTAPLHGNLRQTTPSLLTALRNAVRCFTRYSSPPLSLCRNLRREANALIHMFRPWLRS